MADYGETWVYESIVGALPGVDVPPRLAIAIQFVGFEALVLGLGVFYGLGSRVVLAGTVAVAVAAVGSAVMLALGDRLRTLPAPLAYRRLLFGSSVEVVLGVLAFVALVTHVFVYDPRTANDPLLSALFGSRPPVVVVYVTLLVLWDLAYRIGTGWWASVVGLWRSWQFAFSPEAARGFQRADALNVGFAAVQLLLVPFLLGQPVLLVAVLGHVVAVTVVSTTSIGLLWLRAGSGDDEEELTPT
jgi:hypothetical protein